MLKRTVRRNGSFKYPQHMFRLRNKKNNFQLRTLIWGPAYGFVIQEVSVPTCHKPCHSKIPPQLEGHNTGDHHINIPLPLP